MQSVCLLRAVEIHVHGSITVGVTNVEAIDQIFSSSKRWVAAFLTPMAMVGGYMCGEFRWAPCMAATVA